LNEITKIEIINTTKGELDNFRMERGENTMRHSIAITMGDPSGIGAEIAVKALGDPKVYEQCQPIVIGDRLPMEEAIGFTHSKLKLRIIHKPEEALGQYGVIDLIDLGYMKAGSWEYKKVCKTSGAAAFRYIILGIQLALEHKVDAVVTGPINKEAINLAGHHYSGHTEIFADFTGTKNYGMLLCSKQLKVIHVTTHVSMREACDIIRNGQERIAEVITLADEVMRLLNIEKPRIAVAGLNAHSSENGLFGNEEETAIVPAIVRCKQKGICVEGPVPPDTVFVKAIAGQYDVVVAMYHDQGHIPLKLNGFQLDTKTNQYTAMSGVNATVGLPIIRTSVDHGTAFGKAGEGRANEESLIEALEMAAVMAKKRFPINQH